MRSFYCEQSLTDGTFETVDEADRAKDALNGADIYSGCCTLKVDWGKVCTAVVLLSLFINDAVVTSN